MQRLQGAATAVVDAAAVVTHLHHFHPSCWPCSTAGDKCQRCSRQERRKSASVWTYRALARQLHAHDRRRHASGVVLQLPGVQHYWIKQLSSS